MSSQVSIVIVTWNKRDDVLNLLDSLQAIIIPGISVLVVDNASSDGSVQAISNHPLSVTILENKLNRGGTGGFNTGIRYALEYQQPEYIWLLDNDAIVRPDTLKKLLEVMQRDEGIGIAGSCILNPEDPTQIVEAGGFVDMQAATWKPNLRYKPYVDYALSDPMEVDYVPACSAVVSKKLFDAVGILDERFFLHWDDVDFACTAREYGFKVMSVFDSVVLHGAEKGYNRAVLYYDVRNSLLFISKHVSGAGRFMPMLRICLRSALASKLLQLMGDRITAWYLHQASENFSDGRFGAAPQPPSQLVINDGMTLEPQIALLSCRNIIVFAIGSSAEILSTIALIRSAAPTALITLAAPSDRIDSYRSCVEVSRFIRYDLARDGLTGVVSTGLKLLGFRFDCAVSAGAGFLVPFVFVIRRHFVSIEHAARLVESKASLRSIWKLPFLVLRGIPAGVTMAIKCWHSSRRTSS